jgi:hypothetical protein
MGGLPESPDLEELKYVRAADMPELVAPRRSVDPTHNAFGKSCWPCWPGTLPGDGNHSWTSLNH